MFYRIFPYYSFAGLGGIHNYILRQLLWTLSNPLVLKRRLSLFYYNYTAY